MPDLRERVARRLVETELDWPDPDDWIGPNKAWEEKLPQADAVIAEVKRPNDRKSYLQLPTGIRAIQL